MSEEIKDKFTTELAELRKPVAVQRTDALIREVFSVMRKYDCFFCWDDANLENLIKRWMTPILSAYDTLAQNAARLNKESEALTAENQRLRTENEALRADRYRIQYMEDTRSGALFIQGDWCVLNASGKTLREALDAARGVTADEAGGVK